MSTYLDTRRVEAMLRERDISHVRLAQEVGMSERHIIRIMHGAPTKFYTADRIACVLGTHVSRVVQ